MKYLIANWKMKLTIAESVELAHYVKELMASRERINLRIVLCPSYPALSAVGEVLQGSDILLGAQDVAPTDRASLTGAVSSLQLKEVGVRFVIIGHSERRAHFGESDEVVREKLLHALTSGFHAVLCVGENAAERKSGQTVTAVRRQVGIAVKPGMDIEKLLIVYEPVWAIGTGMPVSPQEAYAQAASIRTELIAIISHDDQARAVPLLYGGSVDGSMVSQFTHTPLSGTLVGNASQTPDRFKALIEGLCD